MSDVIFEMKEITKVFPGVKALDTVNFKVDNNSIHAICGENGAGKSTLMKVLSGIYPHGTYDGEIIYEGEICKFRDIKDSEKKGIVIIHQELALVPYLSIGENMFLGNEQNTNGVINWDETYKKAAEYLSMVGLKENPRTLIKDISVGKQQLVEIAKALAKNVKLLILDEPTASLNEDDSMKLLNLMLDLKAKGFTCIIISHKLSELLYVADKITIMRDGKVIETLDKATDDISEARVIKGMVGREITDRFPKRTPNIGKTMFECEGWTVYHPIYEGKKIIDNVSIKTSLGEVVGIAGLMGSGRTELAMSIFGKAYGKDISGKLMKNGKEIKLNSVSEAIEHKFAYITEDRKDAGLVLEDDVKQNISLAKLEKISKRGVIDKDKEVNVANNYKKMLNIKTPSITQKVSNLSGGNQQKVLLSKWMFTDPDIMILDEPTRGIDVGAKYEIYNIINDLAGEQKSIIFISSEMPELLGMCDRIYVMNEGKIIAELSREEASQEVIMGHILKSNDRS